MDVTIGCSLIGIGILLSKKPNPGPGKPGASPVCVGFAVSIRFCRTPKISQYRRYRCASIVAHYACATVTSRLLSSHCSEGRILPKPSWIHHQNLGGRAFTFFRCSGHCPVHPRGANSGLFCRHLVWGRVYASLAFPLWYGVGLIMRKS
jgi:hypothetical protein